MCNQVGVEGIMNIKAAHLCSQIGNIFSLLYIFEAPACDQRHVLHFHQKIVCLSPFDAFQTFIFLCLCNGLGEKCMLGCPSVHMLNLCECLWWVA